MEAIFRVDGKNVVTSPHAAGAGPEHAARLAAGGAGGLGRGEDSDAGCRCGSRA